MRSLKRGKFLAAAAAIGASASLALTGCSASNPANKAEAIEVVATTTQVQDFVRQIGGDYVKVTGLLKPGLSSHHFDPSASELAQMKNAKAIVKSGAGLEEFLESAIKASGFTGTVISAAEGVIVEGHNAEELAEIAGTEEDHDHEHGDEHNHEHGTEEHATEHDHEHEHGAEEEASEHDHEHAHHHNPVNPHLWTSPRNAEGMVNAIAKGLGQIDPKHASTYQTNASAYVTKLKALDKWIDAQMKQVPTEKRKFVSEHNALKYYLDDYGITYVGSVIDSFEDNAEPSAEELSELAAKMREEGVSTIFTESSISPKLAETVAKEAGVTIAQPPLFVDSLAASGQGATYLGATIANTETILKAWGVTPGPLPKGLS